MYRITESSVAHCAMAFSFSLSVSWDWEKYAIIAIETKDASRGLAAGIEHKTEEYSER